MAISHDYKASSPVALVYVTVADRISALVARYKAWKVEKQTRAELMRLSDAELADIGLTRHQIRDLNLNNNA